MSEIEPEYQPETYRELRLRLRIDTMRLGEDLSEHPMLIMEIGEHCATALAARDMAANAIKEVMALAAKHLRNTLTSGGKPPSQAQIDSQLPNRKSVKEAMRVLESSKMDAALWQALMDAARSKSTVLKSMGDLIVSGFLSQSTVYTERRKELYEGKQEKENNRRKVLLQDHRAQK